MNNVQNASKAYNRMGTALFTTAFLSGVFQFLLGFIFRGFLNGDNIKNAHWVIWLVTFSPIYIVGYPVGICIMKKIPCDKKEKIHLGIKNFLIFFLMCFPLMYGGNIIGKLLSGLLSGGKAQNGLNVFIFTQSPLKILVIVILAPLLEEFVFRKQIIDRCARYGEKSAILFSALMFGLFHMNLFQFFYAFGLGLIFAYVYTRTHCLKYPIIMHISINFIGSVISPFLVAALNFKSVGIHRISVVIVILYSFIILGLGIVGLVLICEKKKSLVFLTEPDEIPKGEQFRKVYCNLGVILFILFCIIMGIINLL